MALSKNEVRIPVIRRITTGEKVKSEKGVRGRKLTHFMAKKYDPTRGEYVKDDEFFKNYGSQPTEIPIELMHDDIAQMLNVELIMFTNKSAIPYCRSEDGETAIRDGVKIKCPHMACDYYKTGKCKANVRFYFAMQDDFQVMGETMFMSSSMENYVNINSVLTRLASDTKKYSRLKRPYLAGLKLVLRVLHKQKKYMGTDGTTHSTSVTLVYLEIPDVKSYADYERMLREYVRDREEGVYELEERAIKVVHEIQGDETKFTQDTIEEFYGVDNEGNVVGKLDESLESAIEKPPETPVEPRSQGETVSDTSEPEIAQRSPEMAAQESDEIFGSPPENEAAIGVQDSEWTRAAVLKLAEGIKTVEDVEEVANLLDKVITLQPRMASGIKNYVETLKKQGDARARAQNIRRVRERFVAMLKEQE